MAMQRDFVLHYGDSWRSPKVWIPVVNGQFTDLRNYFIRAQAREYSEEVMPMFEWSTTSNSIVFGTARVRLQSGREIDTMTMRLLVRPRDWIGKPQRWKGSLEIEMASGPEPFPDFRRTITSGQIIRVVGDSTR